MLEFTFPEKLMIQRRKLERKQVNKGDSVIYLPLMVCLYLKNPVIL